MRQLLQNKLFRSFLGLRHSYQKEEKTIADTIRSLKNQTRLLDEIVVVDDRSEDRTGEIAKSLGAKVIRLEKNSGSKSQCGKEERKMS